MHTEPSTETNGCRMLRGAGHSGAGIALLGCLSPSVVTSKTEQAIPPAGEREGGQARGRTGRQPTKRMVTKNDLELLVTDCPT